MNSTDGLWLLYSDNDDGLASPVIIIRQVE